jgi:MscS family membrane protein
MHVDGFRFDLAATLARELHEVDRLSAFFDLIQQDPVVSQVKLIAEPWDVGEGGYQVGNFPPSGRSGTASTATRCATTGAGDPGPRRVRLPLTGSSDLYEVHGRRPSASDQLRHRPRRLHAGRPRSPTTEKHNEANGEDNRDGDRRQPLLEPRRRGPTDDPEIGRMRAASQRNLLIDALLSQGVPMLLGGDEIGRTQQGQQQRLLPGQRDLLVRLGERRPGLLDFTRRLIAFRRDHPVFRRRRWFQGRPRSTAPRPTTSSWFTPARGAMRGFLVAARAGEWERAARYLDLSPLAPGEREAAGPMLAQRLKRVLDRTLWVELDALSDEPRGNLAEEGLENDRDRVGVITLPEGGRVEILLERVREDGERVWKIAAPTVERTPSLYEVFGYGPLEDWLPAPFFELSFLSIELWQWIGLALLLIVAWAISWVLSKLALLVIRPLARRSVTDVDDRLLENGAPPLHFMLGLGVFTIGVLALQLAVPVEHFLIQAVQALLVFSLVWLTFRLVDIGSHWSSQRLSEGGQVAAISMLPLARKGAKLFLAALGVLAVLQNIGLNVTALIAGLGVGGLAIALAAQQTIENLFGGMTLVVDQPVRVGDFCRFDGDKVGTVEAIGLRSTRIRTLDRTVVTVPNGDFAQMKLETFAARDRIRLIHRIGLRYETTPEQLRYVLVELRRMLYSHPRVLEEPSRVRFVGFGSSSLDLEIFAYVDTTDFNDFLGVQEDVMLRMMDVVESAGTGFAFPSQTVYLGRDGGLDAERAQAAEARVAEWRRSGTLQMPAFSRQEIDAIDDSLDYPPQGSAVRPVDEPGA